MGFGHNLAQRAEFLCLLRPTFGIRKSFNAFKKRLGCWVPQYMFGFHITCCSHDGGLMPYVLQQVLQN
jgi:hypothetical protein